MTKVPSCLLEKGDTLHHLRSPAPRTGLAPPLLPSRSDAVSKNGSWIGVRVAGWLVFLGMNAFPVMSSNFRLLEMEMRHQTHTQEADVRESAHSHPAVKLRAPARGISEAQGRVGKAQKAQISTWRESGAHRTDLGRPSPAQSPWVHSRKYWGISVPVLQRLQNQS